MPPSETLAPRTSLGGTAIWALGSILGRTWRCSSAGCRELDPRENDIHGAIYCFWHSQLLQFAYAFRRCGMTAVVSGSRDGELAAQAALRWGHATIRGSSTKNGMQVVRQCVRALRAGMNVAVIPDGPRGPREQVKPGVAEIALLSGATVIPVRAQARPCWHLSSWDRFVIPRLFASVTFTFAPPLEVTRFKGRADSVQLLSTALQDALT